VRTARLVVVSLGRRLGLDEELLDEIRLAVGEAAARAVRRHEACCPSDAVVVRMTAAEGRFVVAVADRAGAATGPSGAADPLAELAVHADRPDDDEALPAGLDLAVIGGLVDDVSVEEASTGSTVVMGWPMPADGPPVVGAS
jgi:anti-sigma regulatory factor (Ser/Thr protein kinase)